METQIKDSGNRTQFSTGAVRDIQEDKGRCDLLPLAVVSNMIEYAIGYREAKVIREIAKFMEIGDTKFLYQSLEFFCEYQEWNLTKCLLEVSMHYKQGADKYGERNWEKGIPLHSYIDSAVRHYLKHIDGCEDERHDRAFVWNILGALWTMMYKPEMIDIPFEIIGGQNTNKRMSMEEFLEKRGEHHA